MADGVESIPSTAVGYYPCHDRATTFSILTDGTPDMNNRKCPECGQEYEVVTRYRGAGEVQCEWRPVTRLIGELLKTTIAYI